MTSFAQRRLWFLEQLKPGSADYLLPLALRLRGALDVTVLSASLAAIVDRHDVLRTRFRAVGGEPVAEVTAPGGATLEVAEAADVAEAFERELARPIDLAVSPLRMTLVRLADGDHLLLVVVHHIAVDGWSWDVLLRELTAGYRGEPVPPPARRYADFARLQQERLTEPRMDRLLGYWRDRLAGLTPLALPTDRPRPAFWDGSGAVVRFNLPADVVAAVHQVAEANRAARYMVLLGVYQSLLSRCTGHTEAEVLGVARSACTTTSSCSAATPCARWRWRPGHGPRSTARSTSATSSRTPPRSGSRPRWGGRPSSRSRR
uniref:condensation domain-containing protein n=1 Tax=Streptomyces sp. GSL17-111 TaxID=3121596 RepID=UPI0030F380EB